MANAGRLSARMKAVKLKLLLWAFVLSLSISIHILGSANSQAVNDLNVYLSDSSNDSTLPITAPWGEITELSINGSRVLVKNRGAMTESPSVLSGFIFLFFDEDRDNLTDLVLSYTKTYSSPSATVEEICYLCRPANHTFYSAGVWNFSRLRFDGRIDYDESFGQLSFELGGALNGTLRLKAASYYTYTRAPMGSAVLKGGDLVPDSAWNISQVILAPSYIDNIQRMLNDSRFEYPWGSFSLSAAEPPKQEPQVGFYDMILASFSSFQSWMAGNLATTMILSIFSLATIYSLASRVRAYLNVVLVYSVITALIYASVLQGSSFLPLLLSLALLLPLFLWYYEVSDSLSPVLRAKKNIALVETFALLSLAFAALLPFGAMSLQLPFGKTPLIYLVFLTAILIKGNSLGVYGFKTRKIVRSLLIGLVYSLVFCLPFFATIFGLAFIFTGQLALGGYDVVPGLIYFPFMTLCVGIGEEGLFRGLFQTRLTKIYGRNTGVVVQALLFGVWQLSRVLVASALNVLGVIVYVFQTLALGLTWGLFYKKSENLIPLILANGFINTVLLLTSPRGIFESDPFSSIVIGVAISVGLVVQIALTKYLAEKAHVEKEEEQVRTEYRS